MESVAKFGLNDTKLIKFQGFINGQWTAASSGKTMTITNPANSEAIGTVPDMGLQETQLAIRSAHTAFKSWSKTTGNQRQKLLQKMFDLVEENRDDLARIIVIENGKTLGEAQTEMAYSNSFFEWYAGEAVRTYGQHLPSPFPQVRFVSMKQPVGVCALFTTWNFPVTTVVRKLAAALAAGCTVVIKPAPDTPFSALAICELSRRAGFPDGVINVITTETNIKDVGRELCENPVVRKVSLTGSTAVGKLLYRMSASTLKKISIEAGGNAPFIVFNDAALDDAVQGAIACKFRVTGQTCVCANRIYVQSVVYEEFASRLAVEIGKLKVGNGLDSSVTHGPLINIRAIEKVQKHVDDAVSKGASIRVGGKHIRGNYYAPTLLMDVSPSALLNDEETFGPVAALIKFETEEEVIELANNSSVGLAGYIYSRDVGRVWRVSEQLEVGMVGTNTGIISCAIIPFGGVKESGLGREGGPPGIDEYLITKTVAFGL